MTEQLSPSNGSKARQNVYMSFLKCGVLQSRVEPPCIHTFIFIYLCIYIYIYMYVHLFLYVSPQAQVSVALQQPSSRKIVFQINTHNPATEDASVSQAHPAPCTLHPESCTLHPAPCTLHPAPCTLHPLSLTDSHTRTRTLSLSHTHTHTHTRSHTHTHTHTLTHTLWWAGGAQAGDLRPRLLPRVQEGVDFGSFRVGT